MQQAVKKSAAALPLKDAGLLCQQCYVNGAWVNADSKKTIEVTNPATGAVLGSVPDLGAEETRRAIDAAERAWPAWRAKTAKERANTLRKWFDLMMANQEDLAQILTAEQGKPLAEARGEIAYGASFIEWFAEEAKRAYGDIIPQHQADKRVLVIKQPIAFESPVSTLSTPFGMPARSASSHSASAEYGVCEAGLITIVHPAASAGPALRVIIALGKFHGVTAAHTPIGCLMTTRRLSAWCCGMTSPYMRLPSSPNHSMNDAP